MLPTDSPLAVFQIFNDGDGTVYGNTPTTAADGTVYSSSMSYYAGNNAGRVYSVTVPASSTYYVWVRIHDRSFQYSNNRGLDVVWTVSSTETVVGQATRLITGTTTDLWIRSNGLSVAAGTHSVSLRQDASSSYQVLAWSQLIVTSSESYEPSGTVSALTDPGACVDCAVGTMSGTGATTCTETCGDGVVTASEVCDDGNSAGGDGCSATCTVEASTTCAASFVTDSLALHLAADNIDSADSLQVSSGTVIKWPDTSGNSFHAEYVFARWDTTQPAYDGTEPAAPSYVTNVVNGKPVLRFSGASQGQALDLGSNYIGSSSGGVTLMFVVSTAASSQSVYWEAKHLLAWGPCCGSSHFSVYHDPQFVGFDVPGLFHPYCEQGYAPTPYDGFHVLTVVVSFSDAVRFYLDDSPSAFCEVSTTLTELTTTNVASCDNHLSENCGPITIGRDAKVGNVHRHFAGDLAEVLWYTKALTEEERVTTSSYLMKKYGLTQSESVGNSLCAQISISSQRPTNSPLTSARSVTILGANLSPNDGTLNVATGSTVAESTYWIAATSVLFRAPGARPESAGLALTSGARTGSITLALTFDGPTTKHVGASYWTGLVSSFQKISNTQGGLTASLPTNEYWGVGVAPVGDINGDGASDLAVSATGVDDGGPDRGAFWILFLSTDPSAPGTVSSFVKTSDTVGGFTASLGNTEWMALRLRSTGDLNGDGATDLAVTARYDDTAGTNAGSLYIMFMSTASPGSVASFSKITWGGVGGFTASYNGGHSFGYGLDVIGDINSDGVVDIAIGYYDNAPGAGTGSVFLLFLSTSTPGTVASFVKITESVGGLTAAIPNQAWFGHQVSHIGDLNQDGATDLAVAAINEGSSGALYILFLNTALPGNVASFQRISTTSGGFTATLDNAAYFGNGLIGVDFDLCGPASCLAVSGYGGSGSGLVFILYLSMSGTVSSHTKISITASLDAVDRFGSDIGVIDINGGLNLVVGAEFDDDGASDAGAVYLLMMGQTTGRGSNLPNTGTSSVTLMGASWGQVSDSPRGRLGGTAAETSTWLSSTALACRSSRGTIGPTSAVVTLVNTQASLTSAISYNECILQVQGGASGGVASFQKIAPSGVGGFTATLGIGHFGTALSIPTDLNNDGTPDIVAAASQVSHVYILFLAPSSFTVASFTKITYGGVGGFTASSPSTPYLGASVAVVGDVNDDGVQDLVVSQVNNPPAYYFLFLGGAQREVQSFTKIASGVGGFTSTVFSFIGDALAALGDLNSDGVPDLGIGDVLVGDSDVGAVFLLWLHTDATVKSFTKIGTNGIGGFTATIPNTAYFGRSVTMIEDLNEDGVVDLLVGANNLNSGAGGAYVLFLGGTPIQVQSFVKIAGGGVGGFTASLSGAAAGTGAALVPDLNGDGISDIAFSAFRDDSGTTDAGAMYLWFMHSDGTVKSHVKISDTDGSFTATLVHSESLAHNVQYFGDLNGDAVPDFLVGAHQHNSNQGRLFILSMLTTTECS